MSKETTTIEESAAQQISEAFAAFVQSKLTEPDNWDGDEETGAELKVGASIKFVNAGGKYQVQAKFSCTKKPDKTEVDMIIDDPRQQTFPV